MPYEIAAKLPRWKRLAYLVIIREQQGAEVFDWKAERWRERK